MWHACKWFVVVLVTIALAPPLKGGAMQKPVVGTEAVDFERLMHDVFVEIRPFLTARRDALGGTHMGSRSLWRYLGETRRGGGVRLRPGFVAGDRRPGALFSACYARTIDAVVAKVGDHGEQWVEQLTLDETLAVQEFVVFGERLDLLLELEELIALALDEPVGPWHGLPADDDTSRWRMTCDVYRASRDKSLSMGRSGSVVVDGEALAYSRWSWPAELGPEDRFGLPSRGGEAWRIMKQAVLEDLLVWPGNRPQLGDYLARLVAARRSLGPARQAVQEGLRAVRERQSAEAPIVDAILHGTLKERRDLVTAVIECQEPSARLWVRLGQLHAELGDWQESLEAHRNAQDLDHYDIEALIGKGWALLHLGQEDRALELLRDGCAISLDSAYGLAYLWSSLLLAGRVEEARQVLARVESRHVRSFAERAYAYQVADAMDQAEIWLHLAAQADPRHGRLLNIFDAVYLDRVPDGSMLITFLDVLLARGQHDRVLAVAQEGLASETSDVDLLWTIGQRLAWSGHATEAKGALERAAGLPSDDREAILMDLAGVLIRVGENEAALARLSELLQTSSPSARAHRLAGDAYAALGQLEEALASYERAFVADPSAWHQLAIGTVFVRLADWNSAVAPLESAVESAPDDPFARNLLGIAYHGVGRRSEAIEAFEQCLARAPDYVPARDNLARLVPERAKPLSIQAELDAWRASGASRRRLPTGAPDFEYDYWSDHMEFMGAINGGNGVIISNP